MSHVLPRLEQNLCAVRERIAQACVQSGRSEHDVQLIAVTKYARPEWVDALLQLGVRQLGESRPQQLAERAARFAESVEWHLIGHLQRNKVALVLPCVRMIHSVDSLRLLQRIDDIAVDAGLVPQVLLEVNVSREAAKHGFSPAELLTEWPRICTASHVRIQGLMTMAPDTRDQSVLSRVFGGLRELRNQLLEAAPSGMQLEQLSMGMTGDYETAIREGATMVRIGSALFEGLDQ